MLGMVSQQDLVTANDDGYISSLTRVYDRFKGMSGSGWYQEAGHGQTFNRLFSAGMVWLRACLSILGAWGAFQGPPEGGVGSWFALLG